MAELTSVKNVAKLEKSKKTGYLIRKTIQGYSLLLPFLILFLMFTIIPVVWNIFLSLTHYNIVQPMSFIGIDNFKQLFTNDDLFLKSVGNTFRFAVIAGPVGFLASFFFAWVINQLKLKNAFALAFYAPSIVSGVAISVVWLTMFSNDRLGWINSLLIRNGLIQEPILWTKDPQYIMPLVILISLWMSLGSGFLTNLAGLNALDGEVQEAAELDGIRSRFQALVYIIIPQMKPYLLYNAIMAIVGAFGVFDLASAIAGFPSPDYSVHTIVAHMFDYGFTRFELGYASAIAVVLFLINYGFGKIVMHMLSSKDD